ncbi:carbohydrate-responsive element-binding protein-like isoform X2 [Osmerus eperlanus]|uniref:carbohydrate-responsive element-binding protein-like isoform X2 n=1 Tax=Osmerus eperlanus TaxID=29151 RepID=UPI002E120A70
MQVRGKVHCESIATMSKVDRMSSGLSGQAKPNHVPDSESESDPEDHPPAFGSGTAVASILRTQVIHSGHFMVSSPHSDCTPRRRKSGATVGYDFDTVNRTWCQTYKFGPLSSGSLSIDPTLTRLFECMSLAYSGKLVSPKWKSFKGLRLLWRDKIRLNNGIWRAWFIQYVEKRKNPVCGFVTPLEGLEAESHHKPEAIVLEGSYWKRRIEVVIKEYHKWRIYHKKRLQKNKDGLLSMLQQGQICRAELEKWSSHMYKEPEATVEEAHMFDLDCFLSDISDTLFTMTQKPCPWASDRHNTYTSNADMIQPGLTPLHPNLDDLMDIPDIFMSYRGQPSEHTGYSDCEYFESLSSGAFVSVPPPVVPSPHLLINPHLTQPSLSSDSLSQPSSSNALPGTGFHQQPLASNMTFDPSNVASEAKFKGQQDYNEYHASGMVSGAMPYGHQSYPGAAISTATASLEPVASDSPFIYPPLCSKYGYHSTSSSTMASTVITHTASSMGGPGSDHQAHSYPTTGDMYPPSPCISQGYPSVGPAPSHASLPSLNAARCFSALQQGGVGSGRGKHKHKTPGPREAGPMSAGPRPSAPPQSSCLAKLLSSGKQERKPALEFDGTLVATKGHRSTSPKSRAGGSMAIGGPASQLKPGAPWPSMAPVLPLVLPPLHCQTSSRGHAGAQGSMSRGSAVSALLTQGTAHANTPLLIPKTEKLSPVQIYGTERTSLTDAQHISNPFASFLGPSGQTSPTSLLEKVSNPESPHSLPGQSKTETHKTESRRITHISAEQKRRFNIKMGFDTLHSLVTTLTSQPSIKISKATTLQKTAEYISKMQQDRSQLHDEAQRLREEILLLNSAINVCQQQLPATGVPITRQRFDHMREKFREYVRAQTLQNWKFWIFSIIIEPLFESYNGMVSTASVQDLCRTTLSWLDQHCSLPSLRPMVLSSLRLLSTSTSILTDPSLVPEQATQVVTRSHLAAAQDHSTHTLPRDSTQPM